MRTIALAGERALCGTRDVYIIHKRARAGISRAVVANAHAFSFLSHASLFLSNDGQTEEVRASATGAQSETAREATTEATIIAEAAKTQGHRRLRRRQSAAIQVPAAASNSAGGRAQLAL